MILKIEIESAKFENGFFAGIAKLTTDKGIAGMNFSFALRNEPGLDALVPMIAAEAKSSLARTMGVVEVAGAKA